MKLKLYFLSILLLACFCTDVKGQPYKSIFGKQGTKWKVLASTDLNGPVTKTYSIAGDTVMNGLNYKKLVSDFQPWLFTGYRYLREDTIQGKIWYNSSCDSNQKDLLIADLSLKVGDSFTFNVSYFSSITYTVDSIYYRNSRKHICFLPNYFGTGEWLEFIEGIGCNKGVTYQDGCINGNDEGDVYLICAYKDDTVAYINRYSGNCNLTASVPSVQKTPSFSATIYPNPASGILHVSLSGPYGQSYSYLIENTLGQVCGRGYFEKGSATCTIDIGHLNTGIYYLKVSGLQNTITKPFSKL